MQSQCIMNSDERNVHNSESPSSSRLAASRHAIAEEYERDEEGDLSLDNALLADDPLDEGTGKAP